MNIPKEQLTIVSSFHPRNWSCSRSEPRLDPHFPTTLERCHPSHCPKHHEDRQITRDVRGQIVWGTSSHLVCKRPRAVESQIGLSSQKGQKRTKLRWLAWFRNRECATKSFCQHHCVLQAETNDDVRRKTIGLHPQKAA